MVVQCRATLLLGSRVTVNIGATVGGGGEFVGQLTRLGGHVCRVFWEVWLVVAGCSGAGGGLLGERDSSVQEKLWNVAGLWRETRTKGPFMSRHNAARPGEPAQNT